MVPTVTYSRYMSGIGGYSRGVFGNRSRAFSRIPEAPKEPAGNTGILYKTMAAGFFIGECSHKTQFQSNSVKCYSQPFSPPIRGERREDITDYINTSQIIHTHA